MSIKNFSADYGRMWPSELFVHVCLLCTSERTYVPPEGQVGHMAPVPRFTYGRKEAEVTAELPDLLFSIAHVWVAASICRILLMQAFICDVPRALRNLGIAIAANSPMIDTMS